jgi:hypothetical protein
MNTVDANSNYIRKIILEEKQILQEHVRHKEACLREACRMAEEGYTQQQINEGIWDVIKGFGGGFIETFKYDIAQWIIGKLGFDEQGFLARVVANLIENTSIEEFKDMFTSAGCQVFADNFIDAIAETGVEPVINSVIDALGMDPDSRLNASLREYLTNSLLRGDLADGLKERIKNMVCEFDVGEALSGTSDVASGLWDRAKSFFSGEDDRQQSFNF